MSDFLDTVERSRTEKLGYENIFRVLIVEFIDAQGFDLRSIRKTCVHIVHPDGKRVIPFDTYNLLYRDGLESQVLEPLRKREFTPLTGPISLARYGGSESNSM